MTLKSIDEGRRRKLCFLLCMLGTFLTDLNLLIGMWKYDKFMPYTAPFQIIGALMFLYLALRGPLSGTAKAHLGFGVLLVCWMVIARYFHVLFGGPRESLGVMIQRFLVLLPFAAVMKDEDKCRGLKGAGALTLGVCAYLCVWAALLFFGLVPTWMREYVNWSGARMQVLWNPIIFATILFMGIALCVAGCFLARKIWQKAALLLFALAQFLFISMTHSRTVVLMICAFVVGTLFLTLGQGSVKKRIAWGAVGILLAAGLFGISEGVYSVNNQRLIAQLEASGEEFQLTEEGYVTDGVTKQQSFREDMGSFNGRTVTWQIVIDAVRNNRELRLFGTSQFRKDIRPDMAHTHNSWLEMLTSFGLPGLALSVLLTLEILAGLCGSLLFCRDKAKLTIVMWVLCMLPVGVLEPFLFRTNHVGDLFILASGYLWAWGRRKK